MILIIDNGSQYTHLIKRNCRELGHDAEILYARAEQEILDDFLKKGVAKIILAGGPSSVYKEPENICSNICKKIYESKLKIPLLGICYGHQMIAHTWGAKVEKGKHAEYGVGEIEIIEEDLIFKGIPKKLMVWTSHFDEVKELPKDFVKLAQSDICEIEAMRHKTRPIFSVQFHPEVWHTEHGEEILKNFLEYES
ncbi:GMP synthase subunit A [Candidatus Micrarchaeota archaeon]|nr:GMP synthase subunit A [Candidatus Micrarchaeota archaeon]